MHQNNQEPEAVAALSFDQSYEPADRDRHDVAQLRQAFGIATPF
ncbi:hypothetical protein [Streptacidiphilus melanogenes]